MECDTKNTMKNYGGLIRGVTMTTDDYRYTTHHGELWDLEIWGLVTNMANEQNI